MPSFEINRRYYGSNESSFIVLAIDGDDPNATVILMRPLSGEQVTMTVAEVENWKTQSDRRIYYPENPAERRTKIATYPDVEDPTVTLVEYADVNSCIHRVTMDDWLSWRNSLPS